MTDELPDKKKGIKKHRSPNYPYVNLKEAIDLSRKVHDIGGIYSVGYGAAMEAWNYKAGTTNSVIAALKSYGLIDVTGEGDKRQIKVTEATRKILADHSEKEALQKKAALTPSLYREILNHFHDGLPPSNKVVNDYLVFEKHFNPAVVDKVIADFRATMTYANITSSDKIDSDDEKDDTNSEGIEVHTGTSSAANPPTPPVGNSVSNEKPAEVNALNAVSPGAGELKLNISPDGRIQMNFVGLVTKDSLALMQGVVQMRPDVLDVPQKQEPPPVQPVPNFPKQATWNNKDHDQPVTVTGELGERDGKKFYSIAESTTGISEDELEYEE